MECMYKGVGRVGGGGEGGGGGWEAGGRLYPQIGLFGVAMSPRSASLANITMHHSHVHISR